MSGPPQKNREDGDYYSGKSSDSSVMRVNKFESVDKITQDDITAARVFIVLFCLVVIICVIGVLWEEYC